MIKISIKTGILRLSTPQNLARKILTNRNIDEHEQFLNPVLKNLPSPFDLLNMDRATKRLEKALRDREVIGIISDHDCDGQSACAVILWTLEFIFAYPPELIVTFIGHRTEEGYGVSQKLCERILASELKPTVMMTADCGSSDHETIALLADAGIDIIVTDHHTVPPRGVPERAYAVINPNQPGCAFPDKKIAGCFVAWFVMAGLRNVMKDQLVSTLRSMSDCLDFVSLGTMSDCMTLKDSANNRAILKYGLRLIRKQKRPCWHALKQTFGESLTSDFLAFKVIPLINADGRLQDALSGIKFLLSKNGVQAQETLAHLIQINDQRKYLQKIQHGLANQYVIDRQIEHQPSLLINLAERGHKGIHGITASRLMEKFQRPCIMFSAHHDLDYLSGSARSPDGFSIKKILDLIAHSHPELIHSYGGHHQAAGITLHKEKFETFSKIFNTLCEHESLNMIDRTIEVDGVFTDAESFEVSFFENLELLLEPFGKDFKKPLFGIYTQAATCKKLGEEGNHLQIFLNCQNSTLKSLLFFIEDADDVISEISSEKCLYLGEFSIEEFLRKKTLTFMLKGIFIPSKNLIYQSSAPQMTATLIKQRQSKSTETAALTVC